MSYPSPVAIAADASSSSISFAPPGESSSDMWEERSNFVGVVLSSVSYGVHLTLYFFVLHHLIKYPTQRAGGGGVGGGGHHHLHHHHNHHHHHHGGGGIGAFFSSARAHVSWWLVAYITWNFILGTFGIAAEAKFNELTFVDDRNFPGGPNGFVAAQYGDFVNIFGTTAYVILNWFADGLVIYRFWLIYNFDYWVAVIPCMMLLASFSMGVILLFQLTQPNANLWSTTTVNFGIPYWSISISLNILVTSLIVAKLYLIRRRTRAVLSTHHSRTYTSVAAMLVESAALYSGTALIFLITYVRNSNVQNLVLPVLGQVQAISPLLIMWRVARGQAVSREKLMCWSTMSVEGMTPSKISWRRSYTISGRAGTGTGMTMTTNGSTTSTGSGLLDSTFSAPADSHAHLPLPTLKEGGQVKGGRGQNVNVYIPPLSKFSHRFSSGGDDDDVGADDVTGDGDSEKDDGGEHENIKDPESPWTMTTVTNVGRKSKDEHVSPPPTPAPSPFPVSVSVLGGGGGCSGGRPTSKDGVGHGFGHGRSMSSDGYGDGDGDGEGKRGTGRFRGVQVVVERQVETFDTWDPRTRTRTVSSNPTSPNPSRPATATTTTTTTTELGPHAK